MPLEPDTRWESVSGGITPAGQVRAMSVDVLEDLANELATIVERVDRFGGTELLAHARSLMVQSWLDYELLVTASLTGLQAVEATFRQVVFPDAEERVPFRRLVDRAQAEGLFSAEQAARIRAGVQLRNGLSHPAGRSAFTLGAAYPMLRSSHFVVRDACAARAHQDE